MESEISITSELIVAVAGFILSLVFSYVPKLNVKFAALSPEVQRGIMAGLLVLTVVGIFVLGCIQFLAISNFVCEQSTAVKFVWMLFYALVANQATFSISPKTPAVKRVKLSREALPPM